MRLAKELVAMGALLCPITDVAAQEGVREAILAAYAEAEETAGE